ncbi:hypothetical protein JTE90_004506 [Oedothorax gibbosus]|uniref:Uncharacterized protein n=1 Tax=Oedothorax gibbosus TaxID=931172 RepID=A0AAV6U429_9ARAC|nr:hypothetical protein JTE90_004506 [Oedothorax gibbosus]
MHLSLCAPKCVTIRRVTSNKIRVYKLSWSSLARLCDRFDIFMADLMRVQVSRRKGSKGRGRDEKDECLAEGDTST